MKEDASGRRQRAVMATDAEWERIGCQRRLKLRPKGGAKDCHLG